MADISWIKLSVDMFSNRKIKQIRHLAEGNNIVLVWVMLLTIAGRCNAGGMLFLTDTIAYTLDTLAVELEFEPATVKLALDVLEKFGMIVCNDSEFFISNWEEYQNLEGMEKVKEQNRLRKQRQREREKMLLPEPSRDSHVTVTQCHATEEDIEIEEEIEHKENKPIDSSKEHKESKTNKGVFQEFAGDDKELLAALKEFNEMRNLMKKKMTDGAKVRLTKRLQKFPREQWIAIIQQSIDKGWLDIYELKEGGSYDGNRQNKPVYRNDPENSGSGKKFNVRYANED